MAFFRSASGLAPADDDDDVVAVAFAVVFAVLVVPFAVMTVFAFFVGAGGGDVVRRAALRAGFVRTKKV